MCWNALVAVGGFIQICASLTIASCAQWYGLPLTDWNCRDPLVIYGRFFGIQMLIRGIFFTQLIYCLSPIFMPTVVLDSMCLFIYYCSGWTARFYFGWLLYDFYKDKLLAAPSNRQFMVQCILSFLFTAIVALTIISTWNVVTVKYGAYFPELQSNPMMAVPSSYSLEEYSLSPEIIYSLLGFIVCLDSTMLYLFFSATNSIRSETVRLRTMAMVLISFLVTLTAQSALGLWALFKLPLVSLVTAVVDCFTYVGPLLPIFIRKHPRIEQILIQAFVSLIDTLNKPIVKLSSHKELPSGMNTENQMRLATTLLPSKMMTQNELA